MNDLQRNYLSNIKQATERINAILIDCSEKHLSIEKVGVLGRIDAGLLNLLGGLKNLLEED